MRTQKTITYKKGQNLEAIFVSHFKLPTLYLKSRNKRAVIKFKEDFSKRSVFDILEYVTNGILLVYEHKFKYENYEAVTFKTQIHPIPNKEEIKAEWEEILQWANKLALLGCSQAEIHTIWVTLHKSLLKS